jgi:hypothetical protein
MPTASKRATARTPDPTDAVAHFAGVTDRMHARSWTAPTH